MRSIVFACVVFVCCCCTPLYAQVFSGAFDPDCYQPIIGTHGVVDTIYGWENVQDLGWGVKNIGPLHDSSYGRITCYGLNGDTLAQSFTMFNSGPSLNIHKLSVVDTFHMGYTPGGINPKWIRKIGHFRSKRYNDVLYGDPQSVTLTIYWQDDEGRYHDSDFTNLKSGLSSLHGQDIFADCLFAAPLGDDSLIDILTYVRGDNWLTFQDSVYLLFYKGGQHLHDQGRTAIADSMMPPKIRTAVRA